MTDDTRAWLADQVAQYVALLPKYEAYTGVLRQVLRRAAGEMAPLAIIQARWKSVPSFAEKCLRKRAKRPDPVHQFTDLCGARVIARTRSEVDGFCRFLEAHFDIDWENSLDASERLRPSEFGYRSVHYIVSLRSDVDYGVPVPPTLLGIRAEVQTRTMTEHVYSDFAHDLTYKGAFELPVAWRRELAGVAATLEEVDSVFARVEKGLREYASSYGRYLSGPDLRDEMGRLEIVLEYDPGDVVLAGRVARLAMASGDWGRVVTVLSPLVPDLAKAPRPVLRDLGTALCQLHHGDPHHSDYLTGQAYLARASEAGDVEAICAYAGTWKEVDENRARGLYREAFELDPADPYALGNYLELELGHDPALLGSINPLLRQAIERCQHQLAAGINLPWALFDLGKFHLLLGQPYDGLRYLAQAIAHSSAAWEVATPLASLERFAGTISGQPGVEWARRLLLLALAAQFGDMTAIERIRTLATPGGRPLAAPAVIVAGATDPRLQERMAAYSGLLEAALADFKGLVLSGGTTQGICGLVGSIGQARGAAIRTVGYLPELMPSDATADHSYGELRRTAGRGFSPLEPLQNWIDLLASGVCPADVTLIGVNGGEIAGAEYRIALALGATVGLVAESGRAAGKLLSEERWPQRRLISFPADGETLRAFLAPSTSPLPAETRLRLGESIHAAYRRDRLRARAPSDPALADWEGLPPDLRASNLAQADAIAAKLARIGCVAVPEHTAGEPAVLSEAEIDLLAEVEHGRWTAERLAAGWTWAQERDVARQRSPYLVEWRLLPEDVREWDREAIRAIPGVLASAGLGIRRVRMRG